MRYGGEYHQNHSIKRGIVKERDGERRRIRATYVDEDEETSYWIDVPGTGAAKNASYDLPDVDDEVWFAVDPEGEGGVLIGSRFNAVDGAPESDPDVTRKNYRDGSSDRHDPGAATRTIDLAGGTLVLKSGGSSITITPGGIIIKAPRVDIN